MIAGDSNPRPTPQEVNRAPKKNRAADHDRNPDRPDRAGYWFIV